MVRAEARRQRWPLSAFTLVAIVAVMGTVTVTRTMTMTSAVPLARGLVVQTRRAIHVVFVTAGEVERLLIVLAVVVGRIKLAGVRVAVSMGAAVARGLLVESRRPMHLVLLVVGELWRRVLSMLTGIVG